MGSGSGSGSSGKASVLEGEGTSMVGRAAALNTCSLSSVLANALFIDIGHGLIVKFIFTGSFGFSAVEVDRKTDNLKRSLRASVLKLRFQRFRGLSRRFGQWLGFAAFVSLPWLCRRRGQSTTM
jgi:hypothetical protein